MNLDRSEGTKNISNNSLVCNYIHYATIEEFLVYDGADPLS